MMATSGFSGLLRFRPLSISLLLCCEPVGKALNQFLSFKGISAFLVGLNNLTPFISFWGIFASIAWFYIEYWQFEEKGWYLYKMATFPPQHWTRVWRPSLRLGGVQLPSMSLHWDPNTCNLALTHSPLPHHKILFCFAPQTNICYNWKIILVRVEVAYDPENCFCIVPSSRSTRPWTRDSA